ncbi:MAG: histidine--tRNA ligase [Proteobacteria bacterium]|nr:histidine--tRNA ligase [Pseudomonadota bacterium]
MRFRVLPGFRDFYPEQLAVRRGIEAAWHRASRAAGFQEIDGPVLESLDLLTAKSGGEIVSQLYAFDDKGGRAVSLRPEMTPTLARMVAARAGGLPKPIKWYCVPEFYRYEKPQRGRLRAFHQWNADVIGSSEPAADAEAIAVALDALRMLGLGGDDLRVRISDRRVLSRVLEELEVPGDVEAEAIALVDRLERDPAARGRLEERLGSARCGALLEHCASYPLERGPELQAVLEAGGEFGIGGLLEPDFRIVRGLAYYTGPVWEIFDRRGELRAVAGGGRYDELIGSLGGPELPALGFGMGDVVLAELLQERGLLPDAPARVEAYVIPIGAELAGAARAVVARLRAAGVSAEAPYGAVRLGKALRQASAAGARRAILIGPDEWAERSVRVRDLASGEERVVELERLD